MATIFLALDWTTFRRPLPGTPPEKVLPKSVFYVDPPSFNPSYVTALGSSHRDPQSGQTNFYLLLA